MKKLCLAGLPVLAFLIHLVAAENTTAAAPQKFTFDFTDGSCLIGIPSFNTVEVESTLGKISVPIAKIQNVDMESDRVTGLLLLANGDKLTGRLGLAKFKLDTALGEISVDLSLMRRMGRYSSKEQRIRELVDTPEKKRKMASDILNECRMLDAAKDQYALENNKTGTVTPAFPDLTPYLRADIPLTQNGGKDLLGNPFTVGDISSRLQVNPDTKEILKDVTGGNTFWGPYS